MTSGAEWRVGRVAVPLVCCCSFGLLGVLLGLVLGSVRLGLQLPSRVFSLATGDCPSLSFSGIDSRECIDDMEWRAFPTVGETLRWEPGLLPPSGFTSAGVLSLGGGGEEQPSTSFAGGEDAVALPEEGLVGGSISLRVVGGENVANFDV